MGRGADYDALQRTRQITLRAGAETRMDWRYTYDAVGNISRIDTEHGRYSFGYDALDRLTEADYPNGPQHDQINASFAPGTFPFADDRYTYDPISNRLSSQSQPGPWAYNGNSEKIQSPFGTRSYNAAGSTVEERTPTDQLIRRFAYDTEERPVEVSNAQGQRIARYYHDPFGRRLWKTLEPGAEGHSGGPAPETIYLAYNDEGYAAEFRLPGTPETAPTTGPASFTTIWVHAPDELWSTGAIAMKTANGWRYPQHDHLATPRMVIDGAGTVTTTIRMNAFGETRHQGESIANRFPGQLYDAETGLHYNWFRSYAARAGRYTQADPLGLVDGPNVFLYAYGNSIRHYAPTGEAVPAIILIPIHLCARYPRVCREIFDCVRSPEKCRKRFCKPTSKKMYDPFCSIQECEAGDGCDLLRLKAASFEACLVLRQLYRTICNSNDQTAKGKRHDPPIDQAQNRRDECTRLASLECCSS